MDVCGTVSDLVPGGTRRSEHALRAVFNGLRYIVRTGNQCASCRAICRRGRWSTFGSSVRKNGWNPCGGLPRRGRPALERLLA
jgi:hypothetical protein